MDDLVNAIDAAEIHAQNPYWSMDAQTREEYKRYYAARNRPATPTPDGADGGDDDECDVGGEEEGGDEEGDVDEAEPRTEVEEGEAAATAAQQPPAEPQPQRKKNSKWIEYTQIAREEMKQETGKQKIPQKDVFARARAYMVEDGWMKAPSNE